ncbi:MAG: hypothetical protein GC151_13100 [Betaproteobacteria bacterium]|nr:hypothetical protein [Betaproteobacteria bacterium]
MTGMDSRTKLIVAFVSVALVLCVWLFRWDVIPSGMTRAPGAFQLDRWTGDVYIVMPNGREKLRRLPDQ